MELGGNNGGFHGYRRLPRTSSDMKAPDISMGLPPPQTNHHPAGTNATTEDTECVVREQDRFMPIANVIRIMRKILPPHAKISDDAKETIQECVSEYISFITSEANDRCQREQRKTITAEDVLWAMSKLGFDDYIEPLTVYLHRYREFDGGERGSLRGEPLVKRVVDHGSLGYHGFPPGAFHHIAHHHGFYGAAAPMSFFKDAANAGPSQAPVACIEPFPQCKEQL
ncbi:Nuclear transcription factor Y subunit B-6 [Sesamum alatum]|uniref:Nuclear transcription factor Y subunit B-6 n=1 Tax=Sesamum alatum TaxID=300844 RepID=A0AAE2CYS7_9LAMI|nr:Nuclear transcription factor Y subunit B-6 [Sesamum alatum]